MRFYQEMQELLVQGRTVQTPNFRPYFPTRHQVQQNITYFQQNLGRMLSSEEFNKQNPLLRILRLASLDIDQLAQDPSFFNNSYGF